jgi:hypothetical protein
MFRDKEIIQEVKNLPPTILLGCKNTNEYCPYPMSGILPFSGLAFQAAPFCYSLQNSYITFRCFYTKYLSFLTSFTSNKNSILSLIYNFSYLFKINFPEVFFHFRSIHYDINPQIMFWYQSSFGEILTPINVFLLYDLILLSDTLYPFILFSLSIVNNVKQLLLQVHTHEEISSILQNIRFENISVLDYMSKFLSNL